MRSKPFHILKKWPTAIFFNGRKLKFSERIEKTSAKKIEQLAQLPGWQVLAALEEKADTLILPRGMIFEDLKNFYRKTESCGSTLKVIQQHGSPDKYTKHTCQKGKYCKICSNRDTLRRKKHILENAPADDMVIYHVVFTHENQENLYSAIADHQRAWRKWQLAGQAGRAHEYAKVEAGIRSIEVERGSGSGLWHCHLHTLLWAKNSPETRLDFSIYDPVKKSEIEKDIRKRYKRRPSERELLPAVARYDENGYPISKLSEEWVAAGGGRNINASIVYKPWEPKERGSLEKAIYETLKYALKTSAFNPDMNLELPEESAIDLMTGLDALRGVRQIDYLGSLRTKRKTKAEAAAEKAAAQLAAVREYRKKEYTSWDIVKKTSEDTTARDGIYDLFPLLKRAVMSDRAIEASTYKTMRETIAGDTDFFEPEHDLEKVKKVRSLQNKMKRFMQGINTAALRTIEDIIRVAVDNDDEAAQRDQYAVEQYRSALVDFKRRYMAAINFISKTRYTVCKKSVEIATSIEQMNLFPEPVLP